MSYAEGRYETLFLGIVFITIMLFFIIVFLYLYFLAPFLEARKNIKIEMKRSYGKEYEYWKRELRRLYLESIPIIGRFIR